MTSHEQCVIINMLSKESIAIVQPHYLKGMIDTAGRWYSSAKDTYPSLNSGFVLAETFIYPVANAYSKYAEPVITKLDSGVSQLISSSKETLESYELSFAEKKKVYKASMKAWASQNHKSFSEFLASVKEQCGGTWKDYVEPYVLNFYTISLKYKKPSEMLRLAADVLSEGQEKVRSRLLAAWKATENISVAELYKSLTDLTSQEYNEGLQRTAAIFISLTKLKEKLVPNKGLAHDWILKAKSSAEFTSLAILVSADELYYWSKHTLNRNMPFMMEMFIPIRLRVSSVVERFKEVDPQDILNLTWPESAMDRLMPLFVRIGVEGPVMNFWETLDNDEDGVVSLGDLCEFIVSVQKAAVKRVHEQALSVKGKIWPVRRLFIKNGEVSD